MKRGGLVVLILLLLLAFALGAVLFSRGPSPQYQAAMEALRLDTADKMATLKVAFWYGLAGVILLSLAGLSAAFLRLLWQRSQLIRPSAGGLFPVVRGREGGQTYYHDPNRQLTGTVAYRTRPDGLEMQPLLPVGAEAEQLQVTTQAQVAQVVAAASQDQGGRMSRTTRRMVEHMTTPRPVSRLPTVVVGLDPTIPGERRLLTAIRAEVGEDIDTGGES
jgi:hypothetical protein